jgi:hypothetical protein
MYQDAMTTPVRAYQVRIRNDYLENLYQYDAGTVEQEIFARAERGLVVVMTDRPETIFQKFGEAIESVTYLGPTVELPTQPVYANHSVVPKTSMISESEGEDFAEDWGLDDRPVLGFAARAGHLMMLPFLPILRPAAKKILPGRALRGLHIGEES